jgi:anti-anti-sigma regulatory factor
MLVAASEEGTDGKMILRMNGRLCAGTAMYLGTVLEESIKSGINHLILDFSAVSDFDFTGVALSAAVLNSYGSFFPR